MQPERAPDYSLIVPAFNEEALLPATLAALGEAMARLPWVGELVVCDNNSTDRTAAIARAAGARVVFEPVNQISRARNAGGRAARGRWLVWIDADTRVTAELLGAALQRLASGRVAGGGSVVVMEGAIGRTAAAFVGTWTWISRRLRLAAGAFVFALREAFCDVGGFSEQVYAGEELWFSRAVARWGRERGMAFEILEGHPVLTSPRKVEWYSSATLVAVALAFVFLPFLTRSRRCCFLWYRKPGPTVARPNGSGGRA
jgi:glycosyltransferase involved in cell wall biosynthesis